MINIALPKGRLGEKVYNLLCKIGYQCQEYDENSRKLVFKDELNNVSYFWVKPADVAIYVELGAADVGVVGKDIIDETSPDIYELADLGLGKCSMCVAAKTDWFDDATKPLRVATKFINTAKKYYYEKGRDIQVIKLNGSIELAPILDISDVIVDIVETGTTLKENNLKVFETISKISARLIVNKASYKFKNDDILALNQKLKGVIENDKTN
jgi:ATP phosphoribosyltransferase